MGVYFDKVDFLLKNIIYCLLVLYLCLIRSQKRNKMLKLCFVIFFYIVDNIFEVIYVYNYVVNIIFIFFIMWGKYVFFLLFNCYKNK